MIFEDARKDLQKAVELDPECAIAYLDMSRLYLRSGDMKGTLEMLKKAKEFSARAAEKDRLFIEAYYALRVERDTEKHFSILQEIASRYPREKEVHLFLANYYTSKGMLPETIAEAEKGLALDPKWGAMLNTLAYAYFYSGDAVKAEAAFKNAVAIAPQEPNPLDSLGEFYYQTGRLDEAIESYKGAIKLKPDFGGEEAIAYIQAVKGNYGEALSWIDQFILMAPNNDGKGRGYWWKAVYDHLSGRRGQARQEMERFKAFAESIGHKYGVALALYGQAFLCFDRGEYGDILRYISEAHQLVAAAVAGLNMPQFEAITSFERDLMAGWAAGHALSLDEATADALADVAPA